MVRRWRKLVVGMRNSNVYHGFHCLYLVLVSFLVILFLVFCLLLRSCGMKLTSRSIRLLLLSSGLLGGLSDFSGTGFFLGDGLDDSDGHRLPHIADGEATERRVVDERFHRQRLGRRHLHDSRVTVLDSFGESLELFSGTAIASKVKFFVIKGRPAVEESTRSALRHLDTATVINSVTQLTFSGSPRTCRRCEPCGNRGPARIRS